MKKDANNNMPVNMNDIIVILYNFNLFEKKLCLKF
jgi:hypothetical protein